MTQTMTGPRVRRIRVPDLSEGADGGAFGPRGYSAAEAAHMFEEFLEERLSLEGFTDWLRHFPYAVRDEEGRAVEQEINLATLALRAFRQGRRRWHDVHQELADARGRLSGIAFQAGEETSTGAHTDPAGHPINRAFP